MDNKKTPPPDPEIMEDIRERPMTHRTIWHIALLLMFLAACLPAGEVMGVGIEGQRPMMVIGDVFHFTPGSWAVYHIYDRVKNERYRMYISVLDKTTRSDRPCSWMEVEVTPEGGSPIASRFLVEETKEGPGELFDVVVQVKGYSPFTVPKQLYEGKEREIGQFQGSYVAKRVARKTVTLNNKTISVWEVEATDKKSRKIKALVSEETPPLGIVTAETEKTDIYLDSWGTDARSRISGTPINFYLWLVMQLGRGLVK
jgi:hypothetical protein